VVFFKLQLVMFFDGIRSERQLIQTVRLNLVHRWYLGYTLDEELPDHSSLTRTRRRLGIEVFERFFERIVDLCQNFLKLNSPLLWRSLRRFPGRVVRPACRCGQPAICADRGQRAGSGSDLPSTAWPPAGYRTRSRPQQVVAARRALAAA
jgi:hypothetical protein